jgi:AcrR family transcriptional regulator
MPKIIDKQAKKQEIIQAAITVFAQKGFANTKMADIARAANIGKGTIYEYFKNKSEIFENGFRYFMDAMETTITKKIFKITDPVEKLKAIFTSMIDFFEGETAEFMEIMLDFWAEAIRQKDKDTLVMLDLEKVYIDFRKMIGAVLEEGIRIGKFKPMNTFMVASLLIGMTDGLMLQWIMNRDLIDVKEAIRCLLDEILTGIYAD